MILGIALLSTSFDGAARSQMRAPQPVAHFPEDKKVVEIPFEQYREWIVIPIRVNETKTLSFILDTGAPITVISDETLAEPLKLQIAGQARVGGVGEGEAKSVPLALNATLDFGGIRITNAIVALGVAAKTIAGADGIIGGPIFNNLVVEIDWMRKVLRLYKPDQFSYEGKGTSLPISRLASGHIYTASKVSVNGEEAVSVNLLVDTGAGHALSLETGESSSLSKPAKTITDAIVGWGANGPVRGDYGRIKSLQLGDYTFKDFVVGFSHESHMNNIGRSSSVELFGNLGQRVLQRFRVVFDYSRSRMILEPNAHFSEPFSFNTTGIRFAPWKAGVESLEVAVVLKDSPSEAAGIKTGDRVIQIDGRPVKNISVNEIESLLEQSPGKELVVTIQRGDGRIEKRVKHARLI